MVEEIVKINVKVQANAPKSEILGYSNNTWRVKIAAPPDKGKANKELILFLSELIGVKKDNLILLKGLTNHYKTIGIKGTTLVAVNIRLRTASR
jgi:uncharacterized protein